MQVVNCAYMLKTTADRMCMSVSVMNHKLICWQNWLRHDA